MGDIQSLLGVLVGDAGAAGDLVVDEGELLVGQLGEPVKTSGIVGVKPVFVTDVVGQPALKRPLEFIRCKPLAKAVQILQGLPGKGLAPGGGAALDGDFL